VGWRLDECNGDIVPYDLPSGGRVYKALIEVTIGLTSAQADERGATGAQIPSLWPWPHQALIDTGSQDTHVKKAIVEHLGLEPVTDVEVLARRQDNRVTAGLPYHLHMSFGDGQGRDVTVVAGATEDIPHDVIIGSDLLIYCILSWNGPEGKFTISMPLQPPRFRRFGVVEGMPSCWCCARRWR